MTIPTTREELHGLLRAAVAKEIACEPECAAYPQGCGCADNVAMAVLSALDAAGLAIVPKEPTKEMAAIGCIEAETCVKDDPCGSAGEHVYCTMVAASPYTAAPVDDAP